ncbi:MAG: TonB-dependent receptor [Pseudomonadales bacterium]|nr:TonB-dependent receptor [Pseudomonadales bacterium]
MFVKSLTAGTLTLAIASTSLAASLEEVVVTASRNDQPIEELTTNIARLDEQTIAELGAVHINEALSRVAGVWISRGNGQEHLTAIRSPVLTGAGACGAFLMAQDGIPLRASGFCNVNELFDAASEGAGGIEVIKGPGSVLYGSNAMHGMVNILTPTTGEERSVQLEGGPHDYYRIHLTEGTESLRLSFNGTTDGGYKHDSGFDQQKLTAKYTTRLSDFDVTATLGFNNLNQETAGFIVGHDSYKDDDAAKQNPNPEAYRNSRTLRGAVKLETALGGGKLSVTPYFRNTEMDFIQHFLPGQAIEKNGHWSVGAQSGLYLGNWTLGADAEFTRGYLKETQPLPTVGSAFLVSTIPVGDHYDYEVDALTLAAFAQYELALTDNTRVQIGARLERVEYDYDNLMLDGRTKDDGTPCSFGGCRFTRPADRQDSFTNVSPRLGLTHFVTPSDQLYFSIARGFRAPQTTELYRLQAQQSIAAIDSEQLDSVELGLRGSRDRLDYDLSLYSLAKDNFIFRDTARANVDNGETTHQGIELTLSLTLTDAFSTSLMWSYARHEYANNPALSASPLDGNEIDTAPRHMGSASLTWQVSESARAELEWVHVGEYFEDPENQAPYEGHDLLNLRVNMDFSGQLHGFVRVMNLANTRYAERADYAFGSDRYFVGEPASVYVGLRRDF